MNKDDIFEFNIRQDAPEEYLVECALAWDLTTVVQVSAPGEGTIPYAKIDAMGWMWEKHADEIIAHIQAAMKEESHICCKCGDTEYFACINHTHTAYICTDCAAMTALEALP